MRFREASQAGLTGQRPDQDTILVELVREGLVIAVGYPDMPVTADSRLVDGDICRAELASAIRWMRGNEKAADLLPVQIRPDHRAVKLLSGTVRAGVRSVRT